MEQRRDGDKNGCYFTATTTDQDSRRTNYCPVEGGCATLRRHTGLKVVATKAAEEETKQDNAENKWFVR